MPRPTLLEHVGADPVRAQGDPRSERDRAAPGRRRCSCSSVGCGRAWRPTPGRAPLPRDRDGRRGRAPARGSRAPARSRRARTERPWAASASRSSATSSATWTWMPAAARAGQVDAGLERRVGEGERSVGADEAADEGRPRRRDPGEEAAVLLQPGAGVRGAVPIGRLVGEDGADTKPRELLGQDVERAVDRARATRGGRRASSSRPAAPPSPRPAPRPGSIPRRGPGRGATRRDAGSPRSRAAARDGRACPAPAQSRRGCGRRRCPGSRGSRGSR